MRNARISSALASAREFTSEAHARRPRPPTLGVGAPPAQFEAARARMPPKALRAVTKKAAAVLPLNVQFRHLAAAASALLAHQQQQQELAVGALPHSAAEREHAAAQPEGSSAAQDAELRLAELLGRAALQVVHSVCPEACIAIACSDLISRRRPRCSACLCGRGRWQTCRGRAWRGGTPCSCAPAAPCPSRATRAASECASKLESQQWGRLAQRAPAALPGAGRAKARACAHAFA